MPIKRLITTKTMMQLGRIFSWVTKTEISYDEMYKSYTKVDGLAMLIFWALHAVLLTLFAYALFSFQNLVIAITGPLILAVIAIIFVKARKQSLASVGFSTHNFLISFLVGLGIGLSFFAIPRRWGLFIDIAGRDGGPYALMIRFVYHLIVISVSEELVYRGYVQTRMHSVIKNSALSVLIVGVMFAIVHLPIHLFNGGELSTFFTMRNLIFFIMFHVVLNFLYKRYNSLVAPVIIHTLYNFTLELEIIWLHVIGFRPFGT